MKIKFCERLSQLRMMKGTSARNMSLSLGQNLSYINTIENKKNLPSMEMFFNICEYLGVTPTEFFDECAVHPRELQRIIDNLKRLDAYSLTCISNIIELLASEPAGKHSSHGKKRVPPCC